MSNILSAQNDRKGTISGFIYDESNGESLIGANVYIKSINQGASTNLSGYFVITNVPIGSHTLSISYIGFKSIEKKVNIKQDENYFIKINLAPDVVRLGEIVTSADSIRTIEKLYAKPISKVELNSKQINNVPRVIESDLLRSLQTIPGIQPLSDFSSALYVRGGTPDQNLYQIDGTDVYNPEHAFGLFSTFNTNAIKKVELSKGGFSAEYGGRLSSILSVTNIDGNRNHFQGDATVSLIAASATLQAPIGNIGSISGSFRRTYIDQTYAQFVKEIPDYYFYDGNLKAYFDISEKVKFIASFYGSNDRLDFIFNKDIPNSPSFIYEWGNITGSMNWKVVFTPKLFANFWITGSRFKSDFVFDEIDVNEYNLITDITFKGNLEHYIFKNFSMKFGFETKVLHGELKSDLRNSKVDVSKNRLHYIGYISSNWKPFDNFEIETGLRYDYFDSDLNFSNLDPRLSLKFRLNETTGLKLAGGLYHQYVNRIPRLFLTSVWTSADEYTKGSRAYHLILGMQKELDQIYELEVEAYFKKYIDVYIYNQSMFVDIEPTTYNENNEPVYQSTKGLFNKGEGYSYGLEVLLRKDFGALTGWMGVSLANSQNTIEGLNGGKSFVPRQDRTLTINTVANINLVEFFSEIEGKHAEPNGSKWLLNINFIYSTGQPITLPGSVYVINNLPDWTNNQNSISLYPTILNSVRLPFYSRLDLSLTYEINYDTWTLAPYIQIFNVLNRKNVWFIQYKNKLVNGVVIQESDPIYMIPILPSIGVNIKF